MSFSVDQHIDKSAASISPKFLERRLDAYDRKWSIPALNGVNPFRTSKAPTIEDVPLMSNDYLAIFRHPEILQRQIDTLQACAKGESLSGVFLFESGIFLHEENPQCVLQSKFASFLGMEASIICQSGWAANTGLIPVVADKNIPVYIDMRAHASLWEGAQLAGSPIHPFRHNSANGLEKLIKRHGPGLVLVDSVYSAEGDLCPLTEMVTVSKSNDCAILVDESHSLGTHGDEGRGMVHQYGLTDQVDFITASLSKAFAGRAGLIACSEHLATHIPTESRPAIFSSILLAHEIAALDAALDVIKKEQWRRDKLEKNIRYIQVGLTEAGYNVDQSESQIVSLQAGEERHAVMLRNALEERGIFGSLFMSPATPKNHNLMRFSIHSALSKNDLDRIISVCSEIRDEVEMWDWASTKRKHQMAA